MALFDLSLDELKTYRPPLTRQPDLAQFWQETMAEAAHQPLAPTLEAVDYPVPELQAFAATYRGWQGAPVAAWYLRPPGNGPFPALVYYHGYSVNKYGIYPYLPWVLQGYAVLAPDVRGQSGSTPDTSAYSDGHVRGWLTKGIMDPYQYYYHFHHFFLKHHCFYFLPYFFLKTVDVFYLFLFLTFFALLLKFSNFHLPNTLEYSVFLRFSSTKLQ